MIIRTLILALLVLNMVAIIACQSNSKATISSNIENNSSQTSGSIGDLEEKLRGTLKVHYINVSQGDAILIQCDGEHMLIDAGGNDKAELVKCYLEDQGVDELKYIITTHPHEDHIGGMDVVIDNFDTGKVIMPDVTSNTDSYKDVIYSINKNNLKITVPKISTSYKLGGATFEIVGPIGKYYENLNNYSVVIKLSYGNNSFLFTGDAKAINEEEMIDSAIDIKADVLKVGHHGSSSSTTEEFITAVNPNYAVISAGRLNDYGHPHSEVMNKLKDKNIDVYRTDECGTVIAISDGDKITFNCDPGSYSYRDGDNTEVSADSGHNTDSTIVQENTVVNDLGVVIADIDKIDELVTIENISDENVNLEGWSLISVTGNQKYVFEDYVIKAGDSITVASGKAEGDIKWCKAFVWNNENEECGQLIDKNGKIVSSIIE